MMKLVNVDFEELDEFLIDRKEVYNTKIFKELYDAINQENESVSLNKIE